MPVAVDRDLDLDVAVLVEPALEVERIVAERGLRLGPADAQHRFELARRADHPHALATAARRRLDEDGVADPLGLVEGVHLVAQHPLGARDRRQPVVGQQLAGAGLAGEPLEDRRRRPDERQVMRRDDLREALVLGQEAVAGVDRVAAGDEGRRDDGGRGQVGAPRLRRADADRLVRELDRQRVAVGLAVGDDRLGTERPTRPQDPEGDLAAVGDEDLAEHGQASGGRRRRTRAGSAPGRTRPRHPARSGWPRRRRRPGRRPPAGRPACPPTRAGRRPGPWCPARASGRGWKMPTAGEVAAIRPSSRTRPSRPSRPSRDGWPCCSPCASRPSRPGPTGVRPARCAPPADATARAARSRSPGRRSRVAGLAAGSAC